MRINFATYFDSNYYSKFCNLYYSLLKKCPDFHIFCFVLDEFKISNEILKSSKISIFYLKDLENEYPELFYAKKNRTKVEYYFTLTPFILRYIFKNINLSQLSYIDSDLYFYNDPTTVYDRYSKENYNILLTEHNNNKIQAKYGKYNVGWLEFKKTDETMNCLYEWSQDCVNWCYDEVVNDKFADQKYLDKWTENYKNIYIVKDFLINIGPWNFHTITNDNFKDIICYHFHNLLTYSNKFYVSNVSSFTNLTREKRKLINYIYQPYIKNLNYISNNLNKKEQKLRSQNFQSKLLKILKLFIVFKNLDIFWIK